MAVLFADPIFLEHETGRHPESAVRLESIYKHLDVTSLSRRFESGEIRVATREELARIHDPDYVDSIEEYSRQQAGYIEADTVVSRRSYDVAIRAAGSAIAAVDRVLTGQHRRAVCLVRPPGHHALADQAMGFCLFNNVAVAAQHAVAAHQLSRVLIVDWDVHHGNGTQDIFYSSGQVSFFSAHRFPFYPGTGRKDERGTGAGLGGMFNLPLSFGISRKEYRERFQTVLERAARHSRPELILISAGFDAHAADPIGSLGLESEDFGTLTQLVAEVARQYCGGRIVSLLEGGYNPTALAESVACHLDVLLQEE